MLGCSTSYSYISYEVIRDPKHLELGDRIQIISKEGLIISGALIRLEGNQVTIATDSDEKHKIFWGEIRILERVQKTQAMSD